MEINEVRLGQQFNCYYFWQDNDDWGVPIISFPLARKALILSVASNFLKFGSTGSLNTRPVRLHVSATCLCLVLVFMLVLLLLIVFMLVLSVSVCDKC